MDMTRTQVIEANRDRLEEYTDARIAGQDARMRGQPILRNPYRGQDQDLAEWFEYGWLKEDGHLRNGL